MIPRIPGAIADRLAAMQPFETLDTVQTPDGRKLSLHRRGHEMTIHLDGDELMANRAPDSERALATVGLVDVMARPAPRVLIGGLGLGFTLRAALEVLPPTAEVVVAEFFAAVETWGRTHLQAVHDGSLDDPRVRIVIDDVRAVLLARPGWDAVLLDVDNGPDAWCLEGNRRLYDRTGLDQVRAALDSQGTLAVWSAHPDPAFVKRLRKSGFEVRTERVRAHAGRGAHHTLFLARLGQRRPRRPRPVARRRR